MTIPARRKRAAPPKRAVRSNAGAGTLTYSVSQTLPAGMTCSIPRGWKPHPPGIAVRSVDTALIDNAIAERKLFLRPIEVRAMGDNDDSEDRTIDVVFSAGAEYRQKWGREKLVVSKRAVKMDRLNKRIAPVLHNHDRNQTIGLVESARIDGEQAIATLRFSKNARADEIYQDVVDGIRRQISCGYRILEYEVDETNERDPLYTVTEWEPFEVSVVAYAADSDCQPISDRSDILLPVEQPPVNNNESEETEDMDPKEALRIAREAGFPEFGTRAIENEWSEETLRALLANEQARADDAPPAEPPVLPMPDDADRSDDDGDDDADSDDSGKARVTRIYELGEEHNERDLAFEAMKDPNISADDFAGRLIARSKKPESQRAEAIQDVPDKITLDPKDQAAFRITDLIYHKVSGNKSVRGGTEMEICEEYSKLRTRQGIETEGTPIPPQIFCDRSLYRQNSGLFLDERVLNATTDTAGEHTIDDELLADGFIDILLEFHAAIALCTKLPDLQGNITFPRQDARAVAGWTAEQVAAAEQNPTFDTVTLSPKHLRAWTEVTTQLLHQSSIPVEQFIRRDLARALAKEMDRAILFGTGASDQPFGVNAITGLSSVTWPADSGGVSQFNYDDLCEVEEQLGNEDALMGMLAWIVSPNIRRLARSTAELGANTSNPIWRMGRMLDYEAYVTTQVITYANDGSISDETTGFFANWEEMMVGMWGGIDIMANPYSKDREGVVRVTIGQMCDNAPRHDESFCKISRA